MYMSSQTFSNQNFLANWSFLPMDIVFNQEYLLQKIFYYTHLDLIAH